MTGALVHRGPDDEGYHVTERVALGMRRLSIIDVAGSRQPISTRDGHRTIIFNGEIYNFRAVRAQLEREGAEFRTAGDTEVVLQAFHRHGEAGLDRLEGMFAFAIWDEAAGQLTLARDWLGQKSIYWAETELGWTFASEVKALLASGLITPEIDLETLSHYMSLRYLPNGGTLFAGISKVQPATLVEVQGNRREERRLWSPRYAPKHQLSEADLLDELDELMKTVVGEHLESEVPLGAFLSGGIDSSLVTAYAAKALGEPLRTFSIGVEDDQQSELPWARQVAEQYGTQHHERIVEADLARLAPRMVAAMDEPVDPFAAGVYNVSRITAEHVTVALGGDGGDELFAGYDRYEGQQLAEWYARIPGPLRRGILRPLFRLVPESMGYKSLATKLRWIDRMAESDGVERYAESAAFLRFPHGMKRALFAPDAWSRTGDRRSEQLLDEFFGDGAASDFVDRMLHADCSTRLAEHQLPIVDRMSMAFSLEARNPFLDRRVAEFAMRIPAAWQMRKGRIKYIPRRLGERYLSRELLYRDKQGFGFPLAHWFRGELRGLITEVGRTSRLAEIGLFRGEEMQRLVAEHVGGHVDHNYRLWLLFNLELWYRHFFDGQTTEELEAWVDRARGAGTTPQATPAAVAAAAKKPNLGAGVRPGPGPNTGPSGKPTGPSAGPAAGPTPG
jgi:asparagine synthase (glutamine-hydrolysing)